MLYFKIANELKVIWLSFGVNPSDKVGRIPTHANYIS